MKNEIRPLTLFWFRRDLRLYDNAGLYRALKKHSNVLPVFIFDPTLLKALKKNDRRVLFIFKTVKKLQSDLRELGSDLLVYHDKPQNVFKSLFEQFKVDHLYCNHDYEPSAVQRDRQISDLCQHYKISFQSYKDQVIFEKNEVLSDQNKNYTVYTPYKNKWLSRLSDFYLKSYPNELYFNQLIKQPYHKNDEMTLEKMGFNYSEDEFNFSFPDPDLKSKMLKEYSEKRDFPYLDKATSLLGLHLRFGTISIRELAREAKKYSDVWLSELIWREFFMQILWHYPHVVTSSFRSQYERVAWRKPDDLSTTAGKEFLLWKTGQTGYPLVDAGIRELLTTGHMHNRVRMVVASFLTKHLLIHWYYGERFFAEHLLDYDLSANNGNWQWAAGTGCDAAPYFRIFNPEAQLKKFDPQMKYVKKWVPEYGTSKYVKPMVDHQFARDRALSEFKKGLA